MHIAYLYSEGSGVISGLGTNGLIIGRGVARFLQASKMDSLQQQFTALQSFPS